MKICIPLDKVNIRDFDEEVAKGLKIDDILGMDPAIVATCFWSKGQHFEYSWFWRIEEHLNDTDLLQNPWFKNLSEDLAAWMKIPQIKAHRLLLRDPPPQPANVRRDSIAISAQDPLQFHIDL
jgi:hypothetical protein